VRSRALMVPLKMEPEGVSAFTPQPAATSERSNRLRMTDVRARTGLSPVHRAYSGRTCQIAFRLLGGHLWVAEGDTG